MSRHPRSPVSRGSERWVQLAVNRAPGELDKALAGSVATPVRWVSPLESDDYAEYRDGEALARLGVESTRVPLREFWPRRGPQWDALGIAADGSLLLVEAKAHANEIRSGPSKAGQLSIGRIQESLDKTKAWLGAPSAADWDGLFYQYANRLAHLHFLTVLNEIPAQLLFLYFCGDGDMGGPGDASQWAPVIEEVHHTLGLHRPVPGLIESFLDVSAVARRWQDGFNGPRRGEFGSFARPLAHPAIPADDAPFWPTINEFAMTFDGYAAFDDLGAVANGIRDRWLLNRQLPSDLVTLRACLFFEQRRFRHSDSQPVGDESEYVRALVTAIRHHADEGRPGSTSSEAD